MSVRKAQDGTEGGTSSEINNYYTLVRADIKKIEQKSLCEHLRYESLHSCNQQYDVEKSLGTCVFDEMEYLTAACGLGDKRRPSRLPKHGN